MELKNLSIRQLNNLFVDKKAKPSELYSDIFDASASSESLLHAHLSLFEEKNLENAKNSDKRFEKGESTGLLDGIPIAIKDNINIKGELTTCSSKMLSNYRSPYNATVIEKLNNENALYTGKTNLDEFAMGSSTENSAFGLTKNPWNTDYVPGGSSGGSAASVSARSSIGALGSDTGGSIRQPAAFCGLVGFKPTYGTVSRYGLIAFASSLDQIGPITKNVDDARIIYNAISGHDALDATSIDNNQTNIPFDKSAKIGVIKELMEDGISDDSRNEVSKVLENLKKQGYQIKEVSLPLIKLSISIYYLIAPAECSANLARFDGVRYGNRADSENLSELYVKSRTEGFSDEVKRRIMTGTYVLSSGYYDAYYSKALKVRRLIKDEYNKLFSKVDCLFIPTTSSTAFPLKNNLDNPIKMYLADIFTVPFNLIGSPSLNIPAGMLKNKLPIGFQIAGNSFKEETLFNFAHSLNKEELFK